MFLEFFKREVFTALKRPMIYIFMFICFLLVFGAVVSDTVVIGGVVGDVHKNAPSVVATFVGILNIFGLLFAAAFFNNAALRDHNSGFHEILFSTPISKAGYFFGRFAGAFVLSTLVSLGIYAAFVVGPSIGIAMNWIGPERFGPTPWTAFLKCQLIFVLPNVFFAGAIIFALATKFKNTIVSFLGTLLIIVTYIVSLNLTSDMDNRAFAAMVDIFAVSTYSFDTQYFSPFEQNTIDPSFTGYVLKNRILWTLIGFLILAFAYWRFSFASKAQKVRKKVEAAASSSIAAVAKPMIQQDSQSSSLWSNFWSFFKINFLSITKSTVFIILGLFAIVLLVLNLSGGFEFFGLKSYPVTYKMLDQINGISTLFVMIILVFFSGELVWRDRDNHINEVIDSSPHLSVVSLLAKSLSVVALACLLHGILMLVGVLYQLFMGYTNIEPALYLYDFLTGGLIRYLIWGAFLIFMQVIINQKYLAYFASILFMFALDFAFGILKMESKMMMLGTTPKTMYSDMNGNGPGAAGHLWFSSYWMIFAFFLLVLAGLFWPRGKNKSIRDRYVSSKKSLGNAYYGALGCFGVSWVALFGWLFYNTQILNPYETSKQLEEKSVRYEKAYKKYADVPMPKVERVVYEIDIYPEERAMKGKSILQVRNLGDTAIDSLHFTLVDGYEQELQIKDSELVFHDEDTEYQIFKLASPLQVGEQMEIVCNASYKAKGFENTVSNTSVVKNGTFFNNRNLLPSFGYDPSFEVFDKNTRAKYDLPKRDRMPALEPVCSKKCQVNYLTNGMSDWVDVETFISTSEDQMAIAPGTRISQEVENGRRKYHYKLEKASQNFFSFISADYELAQRNWNGLSLEIYYHKAHEKNVPMMLDGLEASLEYYTKNFGPYYHKEARIIEFPRYADFAQAFPGTMPYSESMGFIINLEGESQSNFVNAVIAHEMAHQYWAHQVIGAEMQGSTMLSESFAEYSSLMVMKHQSTDLQMREYVKYDLDRYLRGRTQETDKEVPLKQVENQGHIHYGKGAVILFALQDYIGEDKVNRALRNFLAEYSYKPPPYPTSHDFMRYLKPEVPDSLQYLLKDWFEDITLYDLRASEAKSTTNADGSISVEVSVKASKFKSDEKGEPTEVPIGDWVDIGFFTDRAEEDLFFTQRVYLDKPESVFNFKLEEQPAKAAIDPRRLLIDRVWDDNRTTVSVQ